MRSYQKVDRQKVEHIIKLILNSVEIESSRSQILVKKGVFPELDQYRARYDQLDTEMSEQLLSLSDDIVRLPSFMKKIRMIMIPSVGYFTVVTKQDPLYLQFMTEQLMLNPSLKDCKD